MEVTLVTYNIHKGIGNDRLYQLERIIEICKEVNPDFLALQEVSLGLPQAGSEDTARIISESLGLHYAQGLNVDFKQGSYGNATFSRYPILSHSNLNLTWGIKKNRGCLNTTVELPDRKKLGIMNFHLGLAGIERSQQMKRLLNSPFFEQHEDTPLVILGDTNDVYNRLHRRIKKAGFLDTYIRAKRTLPGKRRLRTFPAYAPIWRLDKVFINNHCQLTEHLVVNNKQTQIASDHLPLLVKLSLDI